MSNNAYNFYVAVNAIRKDIVEGKKYTAKDLNYVYAGLSDAADLIAKILKSLTV